MLENYWDEPEYSKAREEYLEAIDECEDGFLIVFEKGDQAKKRGPQQTAPKV